MRLLLDPGNTLANTFMRCNEHLVKMLGEDPIEVDARARRGTCAVVRFVQGRELWVAGVGDRRAEGGQPGGRRHAAGGRADDGPHADLPAEQARIESMAGARAPHLRGRRRVYAGARLRIPGAAWLGARAVVARALGDLEGVRCGIIPTPEVCTHTVQEEDLFLILASDGVWEFIENEEAVRIVRLFHEQGKPALDACRFLIAKAALLWRTNEGQYRDDIAAIVELPPPRRPGLRGRGRPRAETARRRSRARRGGRCAAMAPPPRRRSVA